MCKIVEGSDRIANTRNGVVGEVKAGEVGQVRHNAGDQGYQVVGYYQVIYLKYDPF